MNSKLKNGNYIFSSVTSKSTFRMIISALKWIEQKATSRKTFDSPLQTAYDLKRYIFNHITVTN